MPFKRRPEGQENMPLAKAYTASERKRDAPHRCFLIISSALRFAKLTTHPILSNRPRRCRRRLHFSHRPTLLLGPRRGLACHTSAIPSYRHRKSKRPTYSIGNTNCVRSTKDWREHFVTLTDRWPKPWMLRSAYRKVCSCVHVSSVRAEM